MNKRIVTDELIYSGRVVQLHRVGVKMPDGKTVSRDMAIFPGAAVVLPVLDDGSIVLIRNYRFAVDEFLYELPAGNLEPDEDPGLCAERELTEETGYTSARIEKLGEFFSGPGATNEKMHAYLATGLSAGKQALETYEEISVEVVPQDKVRRMVLDGTIHDAKTIASLSLYWLRQGK